MCPNAKVNKNPYQSAVRMKSLTFILYFLIACAASQEKVSIQVYYETLCPDSIAFVTQQLFPTYIKLGKYLNVEFKPYGFATSTSDGNGGWTFECQHGPNECNGNLYAACLIDRLDQNDLQVAVINCIMDDLVPHEATQTVSAYTHFKQKPKICSYFVVHGKIDDY